MLSVLGTDRPIIIDYLTTMMHNKMLNSNMMTYSNETMNMANSSTIETNNHATFKTTVNCKLFYE